MTTTTRSMEVSSNANPIFLQLPIEQIQASTTNPRQHFDRAALDELKASIAESGIQVPLLVRSIQPDDVDQVICEGEPTHEIVAGERRFRAAVELGLAVLPCLVRELTDDEARECQIIENLQRADVGPLEEAEAFGELLGRLGSIPAVAAKLGKEQAYVAKCLRLLKLTVHSRDAMRAGLITIEHALLLARLAEAEQNEALKWCLDTNAGSKTPIERVITECAGRVERSKGEGLRGYRWEPESVVQLKMHIEQKGGVKLSRAPWLMDAHHLSEDAPPCDQCDKNTKANAPLFGDLDIGEATCTDGACFAKKTATFVHIALTAAGHDPKGKPAHLIPRLSWKISSVKPATRPSDIGIEDFSADPTKLLKYGQWIDAKKGSCLNVRPGATADWSDAGDRGYMGGEKKLRKPGEVIQVCIAVGCKVHPKGWEKQAAKPQQQSGKTQAERDAEQAAREKLGGQIKQVEPKIRTLIFQAILQKLDAAKALRMANDDSHRAAEVRKWILGCMPGVSGEDLEAFTAFGIAFRGARSVNAYYMAGGGVKNDREDLWKLAKQVGVDADKITAKAFHDGLTPSLTILYPKGVPWPKASGVGQKPAKAAKKKAAKAVVKPAAKKAAKPAAKKVAKKRAAK